MIPEHFYITELGMTAYTGLWVPLVVGLSVLLGIKIKRSWPVVVPLALVLLSLPFWDVYSIGRDADRLCKTEAGLHVYKTVEAEGFLGGGDEYWINQGFRYVETGGVGDKKFRVFERDGKIVTEEVTEYISQYRIGGETHVAIDKNFARTKYQVIEIQTNDILGELVAFSIYPGWWDKVVIGLTGTGSGLSLGVCGNEPPLGSDVLRLGSSDVIRATLKPIISEGDSQ